MFPASVTLCAFGLCVIYFVYISEHFSSNQARKMVKGIHSSSGSFDLPLHSFKTIFAPTFNDYASTWDNDTYTVSFCALGKKVPSDIVCDLEYESGNTSRTIKNCKFGLLPLKGKIIQTLNSPSWETLPLKVTNKVHNDIPILKFLGQFPNDIEETYQEYELPCV